MKILSPDGTDLVSISDRRWIGAAGREHWAVSGAGDVLLVDPPRPQNGVGERRRKREFFDDQKEKEKNENSTRVDTPDQSEHFTSPDFRLVLREAVEN
jgi:hypothetical protein